MGQVHWIAGLGPWSARRRTTADAMSSSPQLAGMTLANPARRQACASCTGVAGNAARTASVPMIAIDTVLGAVGGLDVGAATAEVIKPRAETQKNDSRGGMSQ